MKETTDNPAPPLHPVGAISRDLKTDRIGEVIDQDNTNANGVVQPIIVLRFADGTTARRFIIHVCEPHPEQLGAYHAEKARGR